MGHAMKRPSKYGAKPTTITHKGEEVRCASRAEAKRFGELILLLRARKIDDLQFHPRFPLYAFDPETNAITKVATYVADASYIELGKVARVTVEDIKGMATETFKLKAKWFRACYPEIDFRVLKVRA